MRGLSRGASGMRDVVAIAAVGATAFIFVWNVLWQTHGVPSADIYGAQYPMFVYAWRSLRRGHGLLWNGLQSCGLPFLPSTPPGLLYPFNLVFLLFGLDRGWPATAVLHLTIGGAGAYYLGRGYGLGRPAALCGAFACVLNGMAMNLAAWLPTANLGAYVWLPVAIAILERLLDRPTAERGLALGAVLGVQLLAGCPQISLFTYQVIALRVVWQAATARVQALRAALPALALGMVLPAGLAAVSLLPSLELSRLSVRSHPLSLSEMAPIGVMGWTGLPKRLLPFIGIRPLAIASLMLATAAVARPGRRIAGFYLVLVVLYLVLGTDENAFVLYTTLPLGKLFRDPSRFLWVSAFALGILAGLGAEALLQGGGRTGRTWGLAGVGAAAVGGLVFWSVADGLGPTNLWLVASLLAVPALVALAPGRWRTGVAAIGALCVGGALLFDLYVSARYPFMTYLPTGAVLWREAAAFKFVKSRMTPLDRMLPYADALDYAVTAKSPSVFGIPSVADYEPQTPRRFAEVLVKATFGGNMESINQFNFATGQPLRVRPLVNLLGARWFIADSKEPGGPAWLRAGYVFRWRRGNVTVFENPDALPRAYYVPRLTVVPDPLALLGWLASTTHDPRKSALVEERPADGFLGAEPPGWGTVSLVDRSERVTLHVVATHPGFVVLTDQDYPGWEATVDGVPRPILRANYAFRAVRVPEGPSVVEFRYRPRSVRLGAATSLATIAGMVVFGVWRFGRRRAVA